MLTQLVTLLENKENGLSLAEISRAMNAQPSAVLSMIKLLVQKGRLAEIGPDGKCCQACALQSGCNLLATRGMRYTSRFRAPVLSAPSITETIVIEALPEFKNASL